MPDNHTPAQRHRNMAAIHSASTKPELLLRKSLWRLGFRYRVNYKSLPGKPDIVLPKYRTVIFVHGCFWHGHKDCKNYTVPKTNTDFWTAKIARNQQRDQEVWRQLEARGWNVLIVWECELKKSCRASTIDRVTMAIKHSGDIFRCVQDNRYKIREEYRALRQLQNEMQSSLEEEVRERFHKFDI